MIGTEKTPNDIKKGKIRIISKIVDLREVELSFNLPLHIRKMIVVSTGMLSIAINRRIAIYPGPVNLKLNILTVSIINVIDECQDSLS